MTTARIYWPALQRAADYIRKHGWCQEVIRDDHGRVCAVGAIWAVVRRTANRIRLEEHVRDVMGSRWLPEWNDARGRTKAQVIAALERAARTP